MRGLALLLTALLCALLGGATAPTPESFRFALLGDRTGETQPGIFERVLKEAAAQKPAFVLTVGDTIQGLKDSTANAEWQRIERLLAPYKRFRFYLTPGNHDIWSAESEKLYEKYSGHPMHYGFDYGSAHFTILDNSRSDQLSPEEMAFLEEDLKAHQNAPVKFIVSHRPSWIFHTLLRDNSFPLHQIAKKYGVGYIIAGHLHEMLHFSVDSVEYVSMASSGGHLRASKKYEDGWFFGYATVDVSRTSAAFHIHQLNGPVTSLHDWGAAGLKGAM